MMKNKTKQHYKIFGERNLLLSYRASTRAFRALCVLLLLLLHQGHDPSCTQAFSSSSWPGSGQRRPMMAQSTSILAAELGKHKKNKGNHRQPYQDIDDRSKVETSQKTPWWLWNHQQHAASLLATWLLSTLLLLQMEPESAAAAAAVPSPPSFSNRPQQSTVVEDEDSRSSSEIDAAFPPQYAKLERLARLQTNEALIDYAVGTINTQYYDNSGGAWFNPTDFYQQWRTLRHVVDATTTNAQQPQQQQYHHHHMQQQQQQQHFTASRTSRSSASSSSSSTTNGMFDSTVQHVLHKEQIPQQVLALDTREGAVSALKWLVDSLQDPYSKYLTRDELQKERGGHHDGFLGTGAYVEAPLPTKSSVGQTNKYSTTAVSSSTPTGTVTTTKSKKALLSSTRVANLPVVTAVAANSPAERAGLVVGDRIVAVADVDFLGWTRDEVDKILSGKYSSSTNSYLGVADLTVAKPVYAYEIVKSSPSSPSSSSSSSSAGEILVSSPLSSTPPPREIILGYRSFRIRLPSKASEPSSFSTSPQSFFITTAGTMNDRQGDAIVQYELLTSSGGSIFDHYLHSDEVRPEDYKVGYIRLTRFSKASTAAYLQAVEALEGAGAQSYILDLRNNYGGVIQEAMMTASTLLRDPHAILCWTLNARGGFVPHDVEEYAVDPRYPGYLLSREPKTATLDQLQREQPGLFVRSGGRGNGSSGGGGGGNSNIINALADGVLAANWDPPSSFASVHEHVTKRGIRRVSFLDDLQQDYQGRGQVSSSPKRVQRQVQQELLKEYYQQGRLKRKEIVVLINEGTASSAEFFAAALQDNGRSVGVVGTKSYGKGLIQHTFPMPDGGGLKLTIGEYLRPSLRHVTHVGGARFDPETGELVGGIRPDVYCDSRQGIPGHPSADLCVGVALDVLEEASSSSSSFVSPTSSSSQLLGKQSQQ